jgi:hypothetical protein
MTNYDNERYPPPMERRRLMITQAQGQPAATEGRGA